MEFVPAVKTVLGKYATFQGRASRSEFWWFFLFNFLLGIILGITDTVIGMEIGFLSLIATLALLIPNTAVWVRRLHDIDRSGWWYFIMLVPIIGIILMLVWLCTKGSAGANRFGEDSPAGATVAPAL